LTVKRDRLSCHDLTALAGFYRAIDADQAIGNKILRLRAAFTPAF